MEYNYAFFNEETNFVLSELGYLKTNPSGRVKSSNDMLEFDAVWWVCYLYRLNYLILYFNLVKCIINDKIKMLDNDIKLEHT